MKENVIKLANHLSPELEILPLDILKAPEMQQFSPVGFPSPAENYQAEKNSLYKLLVSNPAATYLLRVHGGLFQDCKLSDGDLIVVDRSAILVDNRMIVCLLDGKFMVKRFVKNLDKRCLSAVNLNDPVIHLTGDNEFQVWGLIKWGIYKAF